MITTRDEIQFLEGVKQFCRNRSLFSEIEIVNSIKNKIENYDYLQDQVIELKDKVSYLED